MRPPGIVGHDDDIKEKLGLHSMEDALALAVCAEVQLSEVSGVMVWQWAK